MYVNDKIIKRDKIDVRLYLLQAVKTKNFPKLNVKEG